MAKKNKIVATSVPEVAIVKEEPVEEVLLDGIIKVRAVIRSMYAPFDSIMIPDDGCGVLIKRGSWVDVQLERGLIQEC